MSDGGPAEEETGEYEETEDVSADRLWNCQYGSMSFSHVGQLTNGRLMLLRKNISMTMRTDTNKNKLRMQ